MVSPIFCDLIINLWFNQNIGSTSLSKSDRYESFGPKYLAEALKNNNTLVYVGLGRNHIGIEGIGHLQCGIEENKSLTKMELRENPFNKKSFCGARLGNERASAVENYLVRNQQKNADLINGNDFKESSSVAITPQFKAYTSATQIVANETQASISVGEKIQKSN